MPARLARLKLDTSRPGFYDDPSFLAAERSDPTLLEAYAAFVEKRRVDARYADYARARVRETSTFLLRELKADGRKGACVDLSQALSRFLERQGVWNYIVSGAVTISFPSSSGLPDKHFWPIGNGPSVPGAVAAHAWVRVPPFAVVDLTLSMQPYTRGEERFLPDAIIAENPPTGSADLSDLLDPEARTDLRHHLGRTPRLDDVRLINAGLLDRIRAFGVWDIVNDGTGVRYVCCAVTAPDGPMETATSLCLRGRYMMDLWREYESATRPPSGPDMGRST